MAPEEFVRKIARSDVPSQLEAASSLFKGFARAARTGPEDAKAGSLEKARYWRRASELLLEESDRLAAEEGD
jgi:hypothetical protein